MKINTSPKIMTLSGIWKLIWPKSMLGYKMRLIIAIVSMILSKFVLVLVPTTFKNLIDILIQNGNEHTPLVTLWPWILAYGFFRILSSLFAEIRDTQFAYLTQRALRELGLTVFDHLHHLSLRFHLNRQTGGVARIIERGTKSLETLMIFMTFNILPTCIEIICVGIFLGCFYDWRYATVTLITMFSYSLFTIKLTEWRMTYVRKMNEVDTSAQAKAIDSLLNYETVKYFGNEKHEHHRFDKGLIIYEKAAIASRFSLAYLNFGQASILSAGLITIMAMAAMSVKNSEMTIGDLIAINAYLIQLSIPLFNLGFAYREIKLSLVNIEDMFTLLHEPYEITNPHNPQTIDNIQQQIEFNNVSFSYNDDRAILKNVSFKVEKGKMLAIVGSSGAGKSTISRLLFRFYDVTDGAILIDGINCKNLNQKNLRSLIGIVPQDTVLFNDTIYYNISYGNPHATPDEIIEVSKKAEIYNFITSLPEGFQTTVGERGLKLSGGEKQRIAIARTLLKKPKFFIFDEATSALDTKTEKAIQENLERISKNVTTIIIAHRLSTVVHADQIIVLENGRIIEQGDHTTLMENQAHYYEMWQRQQKENDELS